MAVNTYVPTGLTNQRAYNWSRNAYNNSDVPVVGAATSPTITAQLLASYEWLGYGSTVPGQNTRWYTNPPFLGWEAGRMPDWMVARDSAGNLVPARILRGYIRRAEYNVADQTSMSRLYFMFNPESISRDYVSYLDQGSLDPFNTVYQSGNLVAPPSVLDFSFDLFFDRQDEAQKADHPGVLVDMEYFDLVVRNVVPGAEYTTTSSLPDNGVMMVNPRDITVVFSPQLSVQGRPINARVVFEKFTHRMVPTRMRVALTMRAVYFGPVRDVTIFEQETVNIERRVPFGGPGGVEAPATFTIEYKPIEWLSNNEDLSLPNSTTGGSDTFDDVGGTNVGWLAAQNARNRSGGANTFTIYNANRRNQLWQYADCSSYVWGGFADYYGTGASAKSAIESVMQALSWPDFPASYPPDVATMWTKMSQSQSPHVNRMYGFSEGGINDFSKAYENARKLEKGDLLIRYSHPQKMESNHVAYIWEITDNGIQVLHAAAPPGPDNSLATGVGITTYSASSKFHYNYGVRLSVEALGPPSNPDAPTDPYDDTDLVNRKPGKPTDLFILAPESDGFVFEWEPPSNLGVPLLDSYKLERSKKTGSSWGPWNSSKTFPTTDTSGAWKGIPDGEYRFQVRAVNTVGQSPASNIVEGEVD